MGKIRVATFGDEQEEKDQKKKADARRAQKAAKKTADKPVDEAGLATPEGSATPEKEVKTATKDEKEEKKEGQKAHVRSKRYLEMAGQVNKNKLYPLSQAIELVKNTSTTKFDGTVEIHLNLSLQALGNKADYRGNVNLPHGTGKEVKVAIADDELLKTLEAGTIAFDVLVAHPTMMAKLAKFARVLGPRGLMPNPKNGTVTPDPEKRAKELSSGEVNFKTEQNNPIVHMGIGKVSFEPKKLEDNVTTLIKSIGKNKIERATLTATMGPGVKIDLTAL